MPTTPGTLELLAGAVARILSPLAEELDTTNVLDFFRRLGVQFPDALLTAHPQLVTALETTRESAGALPGAVDQLIAAIAGDDEAATIAATAGLVGRIVAVTAGLAEIKTQIDAAADTTPGVTPQQVHDFAAELPRAILDYVLVRTGEIYIPTVTGTLALVGIIDRERVAGDSTDPSKPEYIARRLRLDRIPQFLRNPLEYAEDLVGWGTGGFDPLDVLTRLDNYFNDLAVPSTLTESPPRFESSMFDLAGAPPGLAFEVHVPVESGIDLRLRMCSGFAFHLLTEGTFQATLEGTVMPPAEVSASAGAEVSGRLQVGLSVEPVAPATTVILVGQSDGSRIEVLGVRGDAGVRLRWDSGSATTTIEPDVQASISGGKVVIDTSEADGFIGALTSGLHVEGGFDTRIGWSPSTGIHFEGSATIEILVPLHVAVGPIEISSLYIIGGLSTAESIPLELSVGLGAQLGPLQAAVDRIGATGDLTIPDGGGNLGPANLAVSFKPPNGVGLAIDAGVVKGGGYLYLDFDKGEYAGALELTVSNFLSLKAIGLINTKLPGGQPGFSLLVIITAEFSPGFQLGFGFTLLGVGGLLGLNRALLLDPLVQGVRTGAVNSILFPTNVVANAPKIISDLRAIFPPKEGTFLIGPMAKIGWGTPPLVSVSLGVIIEIPGNVVILGRLRANLPTEDEAVLVLQVSFVGALEFDKRRLWFFATMYDSRVLFITLQGEMGLLMDFSDKPNFVLSVGGFHPRFTAPPLPFPSPARIALSLVNEDWARVGVQTYFAITSNSVQLGCRADAFFGFDALSVEGYFSFDALLRFSPFYLIVEISAGFSVKVLGIGLFGVHLRGSLEGPTPWHIRGSAEIEILFFSISVDVDVTFGERRMETLPPIEVLPKLRGEFEKLESWQATLPAAGQLFVSLRELGSAGVLVLHPVGTLRISQRFAPLNLPLDKIGNQRPSDIRHASVTVEAGPLAVKGATREKFAAAQYRDMDDAAKLSTPAYEPLDSGVELGAAGLPWATGPLAQRNVRYETIIVDTAFERLRTRFVKFWDGLFVHFRAGAAVSRAPVSRFNEQRLQPFTDKMAVADERFTVAFQADNRPYTRAATFTSFAEAHAHLTEAVRVDPALTEQIHVIPMAEVNTAR